MKLNTMKINVENVKKVNEVLKTANGKASCRTLEYTDIISMIEKIEKKLKTLLHKKDWRGLTIDCDYNAQNFKSGYYFTPYSTQITLLRGTTSWFIIDCERSDCKPESKKFILYLTDTQKVQLVQFVTQYKNW